MLLPRRSSIGVKTGSVQIGGGAPIVVQSMTNTDTADIEATAQQIAALNRAGSEIVRITVDREEAAAAVPYIRDRVAELGNDVPIVGDFHYNGHMLLSRYPDCAEALAKYRINPGNVGFKEKKDRNFSMMIDQALAFDKPVRIGVNWGSLDQSLLTELMDQNAKSAAPIDARQVMHEAVVQSGVLSAARARELGLGPDKIIISAKCLVMVNPSPVPPYLRAAEDSPWAKASNNFPICSRDIPMPVSLTEKCRRLNEECRMDSAAPPS